MKRYGIILADNGSAWYVNGAPDERWHNNKLRELKTVLSANFEAVDVSYLKLTRTSRLESNGNPDLSGSPKK